MNKTAEELAHEHWLYTEMIIEASLKVAGFDEETIVKFCDFSQKLYIAAMIHGYKHDQEETESDA